LEPAGADAADQAAGWLLAERYRVLDRIGSGGMAEVFRARDELLARDVAVKVFRRELDPANSAGGAQRQEIELQVLAQLSHPNLITLFDGRLADTDGPNEHAYLVMELINGPSLAAKLVDGPLPEAEVRAVAIQICQALGYVHGKGMVHRDVKPANILLGTDEVGEPGQVDGAGQLVLPGAGLRARLSDFGIVRLLDSAHLTSVDFMVGTASYLSPEQARGTEVGPPADIYALGLVLLEALTGERTFPGPPMASVMARLDGPPPIPDQLPAPWPSLLAAMTASDPAARPSAVQVAAALTADAAPVGLLTAADNTVRLAALPLDASQLGAGRLDAAQTQALPAVGFAEPEPAVAAVSDEAYPYRRRAGWLPWLLGALILITAIVVAYLIYHALSADSGTPGPSSPSTGHSSTAPTRTSQHSTASTATSTAVTTSRPATSAATTSAPATSAATTSAPATSAATTSAPATSTAPTSPATSTAAAGTTAAGTSGAPASKGSPTGSPTVTS
jgi:tRNA A-37 threonylcarbamoyl transferase component Bud32